MSSEKKDIIDDENPATFDHLVVLLMSSDLILFDKSFVFSFFLSSRVFMSSDHLLIKLFEKTFYYMLHHKKLNEKIIRKCLSRFIYIIDQWAKQFPSDFRDHKMALALTSVQTRCISLDSSFVENFGELFFYLSKEIAYIEKYEENLIELHNESKSKMNKSLTDLCLINICCDPIVLARQITHIELERLNRIGSDELMYYYLNNESRKHNTGEEIERLDKICNKNFRVYLEELKQACQYDILIKKTNYSNNLVKRTSNLLAYILWFNRLSSLVCTEVVKTREINNRVDVVKLFIETANNCFELGNFNSAMAIIAGLQSYQVARLKITWSKIESKIWDKLVVLTDSSNNYMSYRNLLKETKQKYPNRLLIPVFTLVMKDLNFFFNNIPNTNRKGCLKISKFWQMSKYIMENIIKENLIVNFPKQSFITNYLQTEPLLTEDACFYSSFNCELPSSKAENERLKILK
ncbi:unnamed protein product [Brachionus calyciflorus]|uniref:Ras-GEF domain-containing protein n=1 Tax=Brachionus calyciflorus TaxID=104777 RepID=A0A814HYJ2_9BILA|nr:unnamed protein product [Brachionus calyciflorus]